MITDEELDELRERLEHTPTDQLLKELADLKAQLHAAESCLAGKIAGTA